MTRSGEPTEKPTPKRLEEARRRGEVAWSRDLTAAAATAAAVAALAAGGPALAARMVGLFRGALAAAPAAGPPGPALVAGLGALAWGLAVPLTAAAAAALAVGLLQTRALLSPVPLRPDLSRLSPAAGLGRMLGGQAAFQLGKGLVQVALVAALAWGMVRPALSGTATLAGAAPDRLLALLGTLAERLATRVALVALALAVADYLFVRYRHQRRLRMTRDEVGREARETEGDPNHRAERRRLHRALAEQQMVAEVRKADFVVVNPEHIAVALRYDRGGDGAPVVVASGERLVAARIKDVARAAGVPVFRNVTLARALRGLPEGEEIPVALYEAVAEVLRVVYGMDTAASAAIRRATPVATSGAPPAAGWKRA